ncbi:DUF2141 domain-containing protein [Flavihumibacter fluvii]|uniref:DUF2141 domain-containing protein n=1 Tax=Flavihumibacter fluvii TaxID=2838157 RepID=UPI001BDF3551|nr:DUF2141 domain-containing protein [Flavihumibacter fluvii]ULQ50696.1 DUF2141 domain-containing protein [Flavihumibacter fluvii]
MRGVYVLLFLGIGCLPMLANGQAGSHTVIIKNLDKKKGNVFIGWYNSAQSYMDVSLAVLKKVVPVKDKEEVAVTFENVNPGVYAIAVFFDENGNGTLDKNFLGIPKEDYGFSNNVMPVTRSATFKEASFSISAKPETIVITVK